MAADPDEVQRAEFAFTSASDQIRKCAPGKPGFGAEAKYADAYQHLVNLGARPQIKLKYRTGR